MKRKMSTKQGKKMPELFVSLLRKQKLKTEPKHKSYVFLERKLGRQFLMSLLIFNNVASLLLAVT